MLGAFSEVTVRALGQHLVHLTQDMQASLLGLLQRNLHDLLGDTLDLDVHLQGGHAFGSTGHFEVHVAQVIFVTEDVGQHGKLVALLDQAHGDTGNRCLQGTPAAIMASEPTQTDAMELEPLDSVISDTTRMV